MKLVFLGLTLIFLLFTGLWFSENPGTVQIKWLGYDIQTNPLVLLLTVLILYVFVSVFMKIVEFIFSIPSYFRGKFEKRAHRLGLSSLTEATEAMLAGNGREALKAALKAKSLLPDSPLPLYYAAKAAHMTGDVGMAKDYLIQLSQDKDASLLGIRGLMFYAAQDQHPQGLTELAEKAFKKRQDVPWVLSIIFDQAIRNENWDKALDLCKTYGKARLLSPDELVRKKALVYAAKAEDFEAQHKREKALDEAKRAYKMCRTDLSIALTYARLLLDLGYDKKARAVVMEIWPLHPNLDLGMIFANSLAKKSAAERLKHIENLHELNQNNMTSQLFMGKSYMKESLWGEARRVFEKLGQQPNACKAVFTSLAELEEQEYGNRENAANWLRQASTVPNSAHWACTSCEKEHARHYVVCPHCHSFDTVKWGKVEPGYNLKKVLLPIGFEE